MALLWRSTRFSGAKIWKTLPLDLRSEHNINNFAFGLKMYFRSKPNWTSLTFFILTSQCTNFLSRSCVVFSFSSGPPWNQPRWTGHPWLNSGFLELNSGLQNHTFHRWTCEHVLRSRVGENNLKKIQAWAPKPEFSLSYILLLKDNKTSSTSAVSYFLVRWNPWNF